MKKEFKDLVIYIYNKDNMSLEQVQEQVQQQVYKEFKTRDYNKYMREYQRVNYNKNKQHILRLKNTRNLLKKYDVDESIKNEFKEYLYDCKVLIEILQEMPSDLLQNVLDKYANDGDKLFIKKIIE